MVEEDLAPAGLAAGEKVLAAGVDWVSVAGEAETAATAAALLAVDMMGAAERAGEETVVAVMEKEVMVVAVPEAEERVEVEREAAWVAVEAEKASPAATRTVAS